MQEHNPEMNKAENSSLKLEAEPNTSVNLIKDNINCPICACKLSQSVDINLHIDLCLNRSVIKEVIVEDTKNEENHILKKKRKSSPQSNGDALAPSVKKTKTQHKSIKSYFTQT